MENIEYVPQHYNIIGINENSVISNDESIISNTSACGNIRTNEILTSSDNIDSTAFYPSSNIKILSFDDSIITNENSKPMIIVSETENAKTDTLNMMDTHVSQDNLTVSYSDVSTNNDKTTVDSIVHESNQRISELFLNQNMSNIDNNYIVENVKNMNNHIPLNSDNLKPVEVEVTQNMKQNNESTSDEVLLDMLDNTNSDEKKEFHELKTSSYYESFVNLELITDPLSASSKDVDRNDQFLRVEKNMYKLFKGDSFCGYDSNVEMVGSVNKTQFPSENYVTKMKMDSAVNMNQKNTTAANSVFSSNAAELKREFEHNQDRTMKKKNSKTNNKVQTPRMQTVKKTEIIHSTPKFDKLNVKKSIVCNKSCIEKKGDIVSSLLKPDVNNKIDTVKSDELHVSSYSKPMICDKSSVENKEVSSESNVNNQLNVKRIDKVINPPQVKNASSNDLVSENHDLCENINNQKHSVNKKNIETNLEPEKSVVKYTTTQSCEKNVKQEISAERFYFPEECNISKNNDENTSTEVSTLEKSAVSGRSVRVRKKLILPDFAYDIDFINKENLNSSTKTPNKPKDIGERRGRGRPRKSNTFDGNHSQTSNAEDNDVKPEISNSVVESLKNERIKNDITEDSKQIFPLTKKRGRKRKRLNNSDDFSPVEKKKCSLQNENTKTASLDCRSMKYVKYDNENSAFSRKGLQSFQEYLKKIKSMKTLCDSNSQKSPSVPVDTVSTVTSKQEENQLNKSSLSNESDDNDSDKLQVLKSLKLPDGIVFIKKQKLGEPCIKKVAYINPDGSSPRESLSPILPDARTVQRKPKLQKKKLLGQKYQKLKTANEIRSSLPSMKNEFSENKIKKSNFKPKSNKNTEDFSVKCDLNESKFNKLDTPQKKYPRGKYPRKKINLKKTKIDSRKKKDGRGKWSRKKKIVEKEGKDFPEKKPRGRPKKEKIMEMEKESFLTDVTDETISIDKELYEEDMRNYSNCWKMFKKINNEKYSNEMVMCGRCKKKMTLQHYKRCHQVTHYFLCWLEGEKEINLEKDEECIKILQSHISPDALKKKIIRLVCEICGDIRKSAIGYVSHVKYCNRTGATELLEQCKYCAISLKPAKLKRHYSKCEEYEKANESFKDGNKYTDNSVKKSSILSKRSYMTSYERKSVTKFNVLEDDQFWINLKTSYDLFSCMGLGCKHMTLSKDDLKSHLLNCSANFCEFSCSSCQFQTKYENEIIYHCKRGCQDVVAENTEMESEKDNNIELNTVTEVTGRRVSTRVKKLNYKYDSDESTDNDVKKEKDKDAVIVSESNDSDDSYSGGSWDENPKSRVKKKDTSDESDIKNAFHQYCLNQNCDPLNWTVELRLNTLSSCTVHEELKISADKWNTFPLMNLFEHCTIESKSIKVTFDNDTFTQFSLFQSDVINTVPLCFIGGPVWAMSWAPLPAFVSEQYLAVSGLQNMNHVVKINEAVKFASLIQIWKFGSLDNMSNDVHRPILSLAIKHDFGAIWAMAWCPSGGYDNSSTPCRLGILACATSAGCAIIYSVPKFDIGTENTKNVCTKEPDLILKVRLDNVQCTRLVWQRNYNHTIIYGGFSNGMVALWNISTSSTILREGNIIYPYRTFDAHTSAITGLDIHWMDKGRYLFTSSFARTTKYWDLNDLSGPMYESEKSAPVLDGVWMQHWMVTAHGQDFISNVETAAFIQQSRDTEDKRKMIANMKDTTWSVSYSDWNDTVAVSTNGGYVSVFAAKYLSALKFKNALLDKIVTATKLVPFENNVDTMDDDLQKTKNTDDSFDYSAVVNKYGVFFSDRVKQKINPEDFCFDIKRSSATSINKVCWNQNYKSFNWIALGYECGFVRVMRVERFDKHHLTKFYKMNEDSDIAFM